MKDRNGKSIHEGELIKIVDRSDIDSVVDFWTVFDVIEVGIYVDFVLKHCVTNEIKILPQANIERSY